MAGREDPPTAKQLDLIEQIFDYAEPSVPEFKGKTKKEASVYISKYLNRLGLDSWCIEHGY